MHFTETDLFGVYVAPFAILMVVAYVIFLAFRWLAARQGWLDRVWHPGLFEIAVYVIILSVLVLAAANLTPLLTAREM